MTTDRPGAVDLFFRGLQLLMALALAVMVVLVFGNVVLRYGFSSGIQVSEELSRWLFVWVTFLGAVVAMRQRAHLGTDVVVSRLSRRGKQLCAVLGQLAMLGTLVLLMRGAWLQARINWDVEAPGSGLSMAWVYGVGVVFALIGVPVLLAELARTLRRDASEEDLRLSTESEERLAS